MKKCKSSQKKFLLTSSNSKKLKVCNCGHFSSKFTSQYARLNILNIKDKLLKNKFILNVLSSSPNDEHWKISAILSVSPKNSRLYGVNKQKILINDFIKTFLTQEYFIQFMKFIKLIILDFNL